MVQKAFHDRGPPYVKWAAEMAVGLQTGVPWVMCKQDDAPDPVVSLLISKLYEGSKYLFSLRLSFIDININVRDLSGIFHIYVF